MSSKIILVLGGAKSGKSRFARDLACKWKKEVAYVATLLALDEEMALKIEEHKGQRPPTWLTIEEGEDLVSALKQVADREIIIVDCLTLFISNLLLKGVEEGNILNNLERFIERSRESKKKVIFVSNEVGMGIVPENKLARQFREIAGKVNQMVASVSDEVYLLVAGKALRIKS